VIGEEELTFEFFVHTKFSGIEQVLDFVHLTFVDVEKSGGVDLEAAAVRIE